MHHTNETAPQAPRYDLTRADLLPHAKRKLLTQIKLTDLRLKLHLQYKARLITFRDDDGRMLALKDRHGEFQSEVPTT